MGLSVGANRCVREYWGLLGTIVAEGACTHDPARGPTQQSRNEALRQAMLNSSGIFGVFDVCAEAEALFKTF